MDLLQATHKTFVGMSNKLQHLKTDVASKVLSPVAYMYAVDKISTDCYTIGKKITKCNDIALITYEGKFRNMYHDCIRLRSKINPRGIRKI